MALKKVKGNLERLFDKNLSDLVRGIRNNKDNEGKYIAQCMEEIKVELRQDNIAVKANAITKLTYLQMIGYDISWAGFNVIEVMSSSKFTHKRIGYLSASQCFHSDSELLMLTTNMIRKDLSSQNQYEAGVALSALSCFVSSDLARDLANDVMILLTSTKPYLRKKGVLMLYKIFLKYPDALRPAFPRLKEKLEDPDPGVQSAAVNVVCELARKNPKNYLSLAPIFFKLMTTSTNNWMLIKIIKLFAEMAHVHPEIGRRLALPLFGALTPLEPRLGKKLIEPLTNLIHSTSAMSLLYECINTTIAVLISISTGMPNHNASIQLCVQKLRILIEDSDQNLKYLGLLAMSRILTTHPKSVQMHKDLVMRCLDDKDESIRLRALDLLYGMVSKKNLMEIVKKLMVHMEKAEGTTYRDELLAKIIQICSQNNYQHITNFEWYVSVLVELTRVEGVSHGDLVAEQLLDVAVRVHAIRPFCAQQMSILIENPFVIFGLSGGSSRASSMTKVLYAAGWICGEYVQFLPNPKTTLLAMLEPKMTQLPFQIQAVFLQNSLKILSHILCSHTDAGEEERAELVCLAEIQEKTKPFVSSSDLEVQERAGILFNIIKAFLKLQAKGEMDLSSLGTELKQFFVIELNPVAPKAQKKVPIPEGLDLDAWINDPPSESEEEEDVRSEVFVQTVAEFYGETKERQAVPKLTEEEVQRLREARKHEQELNPHYLKPTAKSGLLKSSGGNGTLADIPPVAALELNIPLQVAGLASSDKYLKVPSKRNKKLKKKKRGKNKDKDKVSDEDEDADAEDSSAPTHVVNTMIEMPDGATVSDNEDSHLSQDDPHRALDIDLDIPLEANESIPVRSHRVTSKKDPNYLSHAPINQQNGDDEIEEEPTKKLKKKSRKEDKEGKKKKKTKKEKGEKKNRSSSIIPPGSEKEVNLLLDSFEAMHLTEEAVMLSITTQDEQEIKQHNGNSSNEYHENDTAVVEEYGRVEESVVVAEKSSKKSKKVKKEKKKSKFPAVTNPEQEVNLF